MNAKEQLAAAEGRHAYAAGKSVDANPHPGGKTESGFNPCRYWWYMGWYDAKHEAMGLMP